MTYDASNRKDIRRAEKSAKTTESLRLEFLRLSMNTASGRAWFCDLLEFCHIFNDPFSGVALTEAYSKGERNVGLKIYTDVLITCPDQFVTMMRESNERRTIAEQSRSQNPGRDADRPSDNPDDFDPYAELGGEA